jgi:UDPglucose 6-dehydrogenase
MNKTKITVVGSGYVGMSMAVLLSQKNDVVVLDINSASVDKINNGHSTVHDKEIKYFFNTKVLNLSATLDKEIAYQNSDFIIVATPTDYDEIKDNFDTGSVDQVVKDAIHFNNQALIVIKSTIPIGHTDKLKNENKSRNIVFSPEFLREGSALKDNLYPSRIIVGGECTKSKNFSKLLEEAAIKDPIQTFFMPSSEAEAVKLFSNTYLAMRVSFFNELDSFALRNNLDSENIINAVCMDDRIGNNYNNPSFGYGGYCLPKDTKQLLSNYKNTPQKLIQAIVESNSTRKDFIADEIIKRKPKTAGFFRLIMKSGSDNFRSSSILGIIKRLQEGGINVVIYEPTLDQEKDFNGYSKINDLDEFKSISDIIITNRLFDSLSDVRGKVFTRDIFGDN